MTACAAMSVVGTNSPQPSAAVHVREQCYIDRAEIFRATGEDDPKETWASKPWHWSGSDQLRGRRELVLTPSGALSHQRCTMSWQQHLKTLHQPLPDG
jgi:hypothetical protein